eukprot:359054-Chlamydomonas_euryale.AAC.1
MGHYAVAWAALSRMGRKVVNGAAWAAWSWMGLHGAGWGCMELDGACMGLHGAACRCNSSNLKESQKSSRQLFPLLLLYLLLLLILPSPTRDGVLMTAFGSLLCTCAHQVHAQKDRHASYESFCTPWHTLVAEAPNPLCEIHTVRGKCGACKCGGSRSASPARTVRIVRDVLRIRTHSTPGTPSMHAPCNPDAFEEKANFIFLAIGNRRSDRRSDIRFREADRDVAYRI